MDIETENVEKQDIMDLKTTLDQEMIFKFMGCKETNPDLAKVILYLGDVCPDAVRNLITFMDKECDYAYWDGLMTATEYFENEHSSKERSAEDVPRGYSESEDEETMGETDTDLLQ